MSAEFPPGLKEKRVSIFAEAIQRLRSNDITPSLYMPFAYGVYESWNDERLSKKERLIRVSADAMLCLVYGTWVIDIPVTTVTLGGMVAKVAAERTWDRLSHQQALTGDSLRRASRVFKVFS